MNTHVVPPDTAAQLARLELMREAAGVSTTAPDDDDDRFCGCGNLLYPGTTACGECEPVADMHARYAGTWRVGLVGGRCS